MPDSPVPRAPGPDTPFEIGIVMAGAISAGAYTAGVIDFLIEALDAWEKAKDHARKHPEDPAAVECPMHEVKLRVLAGASAGGMTAGLTAGLLGMDYESVTRQPPPGHSITPANNNLYRNWVNTIDIGPLLGVKDLDSERDSNVPVQSLLDSSLLVNIADNAFDFERPESRTRRPYVADPLHVLLAVTNLRGIPYAPDFDNWKRTEQFEMMMHADHMHFILSPDRPREHEGAFWLKPYDFGNRSTWGVLQASALATGAFPVGLAPRLLKRRPAQYAHREWPIPGPYEKNGVHYCEYWKEIPPRWPEVDAEVAAESKEGKTFEYEFLCVDGGVMDNEPLDLTRHLLAGPEGSNPRTGDTATRAVIMVMPFPNAAPFPAAYDGRTNLIKLLVTTFISLIKQSRFRPDELVLADDPDVYSRFLVVPRRGSRHDGTLEPYAIASGSIEGFGGFLSRRFREHDYQLGRRNCQRFLQEYFALPSEGEKRNKLFDAWTDEARARHRIEAPGQGTTVSPGMTENSDVLSFLPIIPLVGKAADPVPEPVWPAMTDDELQALRPKVQYRLRRVVNALIDQNIQFFFWGPLARWALKVAYWFVSRRVVDSIMQWICDDLILRGLLKR